jgi:hypothetical protein
VRMRFIFFLSEPAERRRKLSSANRRGVEKP